MKQTSEVTDIVGHRIYPRLCPQDESKPYLVVMRPPGQELGQTNDRQIGVARTPVVIACVGIDYDESRSLSDPISLALNPPGWDGSKFWNETEIASCQPGGTYDQSIFPQLADEIGFPVEFITFELEHST